MIDQIYGFGNGLISAGWWTGAAWPTAWALIKIIVLVAPLMGAVQPAGATGLPDPAAVAPEDGASLPDAASTTSATGPMP